MSPEAIVAIIGGGVAFLGLVALLIRKVPKRLKGAHYTRQWRELQTLCANKDTWPEAIMAADAMLDEVLRKRRVSGKTMGERMVEAEESFSNKDSIWQAHKLANHLGHSDDATRLKDTDVKTALIAFRQALRDLGAL